MLSVYIQVRPNSISGHSFSSNGICKGSCYQSTLRPHQSQPLGIVTEVMVSAGELCYQSTLRPDQSQSLGIVTAIQSTLGPDKSQSLGVVMAAMVSARDGCYQSILRP